MKRIKPFLLSFFISTFVLSIMSFITYSIIEARSSAQVNYTTQNEQIINTYSPKEADNFSILIIGCKQRNLPADFFVLLHFDAPNNMLYIIPLPETCQSTVNIKTQTLKEHYRYSGVSYAKKAVENLFMTEIDEYIRLDYQTSAKLVDYFSYIDFNCAYPISTGEYNFPEGEQLLDGKRYASLLFSGDDALYPSLIKNFFEQCFNADLTERLDGFFDIIFDYSDSSICELDIKTRIKAIKAFTQKKTQKISVITPGGEEAFNKFIISDKSFDLIKGILS